MPTTFTRALPEGFGELERHVADWAKPSRAQRYATRLAKPFDDVAEFYDAIAPRAEEAIAYLDGLDLDALPDDATRLMQLLYSMIQSFRFISQSFSWRTISFTVKTAGTWLTSSS